MCDHTKKKIQNDIIQEKISVAPIEEKMTESIKVVWACPKKVTRNIS